MVINGSVREGRRSDIVQNWLVEILHHDPELELDIADLKEVALPFFNEAVPPDEAHGQFKSDVGTAWAKRVAEADAFIMLVAEYNHGPTAVLKNAIDWVYDGWLHKPVGFISYGGLVGGARAVEQLKQIVMNVQLTPVNIPVLFPLISKAFDDQGEPINQAVNESLQRMLAELKELQKRLAR